MPMEEKDTAEDAAAPEFPLQYQRETETQNKLKSYFYDDPAK